MQVSGTLYDCENQSVSLPHVMLDTGTSLTIMEEKMLSRLGLCGDELVSLSSIGIQRLVVADGQSMPVFRLYIKIK